MQRQDELNQEGLNSLTPDGQAIYRLAIAKDKSGIESLIESERQKWLKTLGHCSRSFVAQLDGPGYIIDSYRFIQGDTGDFMGEVTPIVGLLAQHGEVEAVDFLVDNFGAEGTNALRGAVMGGNKDLVKKYGEKDSIQAHRYLEFVYDALRHRQYEMVDLLIELGADVRNAAEKCLYVFYLHNKPNVDMPLDILLLFGNKQLHREMIKQLLARNESISYQDLEKETDKWLQKVTHLYEIKQYYHLSLKQMLALEKGKKGGLFWLLHGMPLFADRKEKELQVHLTPSEDLPLLPPELMMMINAYVLDLSDEETANVVNEVNNQFVSKRETYRASLSHVGFWSNLSEQATQGVDELLHLTKPNL
jgi:hypothetical protein